MDFWAAAFGRGIVYPSSYSTFFTGTQPGKTSVEEGGIITSMETSTAAEEPGSALKMEIKQEEDAWLAESCFEDGGEQECRVKVEEEEEEEDGVEEEEEEDHLARVKEQLKKSRCKVVIRDCIGRVRGKRYGAAGKWLLENGSIVVKEEVGNCCQFSCGQCSKNFQSYEKMIKHRKNAGCTKVPMQVSVASAYMCSICSVIVLNDLTQINSHYRDKHGVCFRKHMQRIIGGEGRLPQQHSVYNQRERAAKFLEGCPLSSEVGNMCSFRCRGCNKIFTSLWYFKHHSYCLQKKGLPPCSGDTGNWLHSVEKAVAHKCKMCSKLILCDRERLRRHIQTQHKITVDTYMKKHLSQETKNDSAAVVMLKKKTPIECIRLEKEQEAKEKAIRLADLHQRVPMIDPLESKKMLPKILPRSMTTNVVENLCKYKCKEKYCFFRTSSWYILKHHVKRTHGLPTLSYHPELLVEARYHKCRLCSRDILCDKAVISVHARSSHNITLKQFISGDYGKCTPPKNIMVYKRLFPKDMIPRKFLIEKVTNACTYTCPTCGKKSESWSSFSEHLLRCCGKCKMEPQYVTEARYHECRLCSRVMLCDNRVVRNHILQTHGNSITFKAYLSTLGMAGVMSKEESDKIRQSIPADDSYGKRADILRSGDLRELKQ